MQEVGYSKEIDMIHYHYSNPRRPMSLEPQSSADSRLFYIPNNA